MVVTISIIGSAARSLSDQIKFNSRTFHQAFNHAKFLITEFIRSNPSEKIVLVSGGSAWIDHIAVKLFLFFQLEDGIIVQDLKLHLPCGYKEIPETQAIRFDSDSSAGRRLNELNLPNLH